MPYICGLWRFANYMRLVAFCKRLIDTKQGKVINTLTYPGMSKILENIYQFKSEKTDYLAGRIVDFIDICKKWLDITDSEFILDPNVYHVGGF